MRLLSSIKGRLILANTAGVAVVLVVLGFAAYTMVRTIGTTLIDEGLKARAVEISRGPMPMLGEEMGPGGPPAIPGPAGSKGSMTPAGPDGPGRRGPEPQGPPPDGPPPMSFENLTIEALREAEIRRPRIIRPDGQVLAPREAAAAWSRPLFEASLKGRQASAQVRWDDADLRVASVPVMRKGRTIGVIQIAQSLEGVDLAAQSLGRILLILLPAALGLSAAAGWWLVKTSLAPVERTTREAEAITASGAVDRRLPVIGANEISRLSAALNAMLDRIQLSLDQEKALRGRLENALYAQKRFSGDASHELRTPLTRISLAAENGLFSAKTEDKDRALTRIKASSMDMARLVHNLLALARADSGALPVSLEPLAMDQVIREVLEDGPWASDPRLRVELPETTLTVLADRVALNRILTNLLDNAFRHTPSDGSVTLGAHREGDRCLVYVADTGEGIPASHLARIGERFLRVEESRERTKGGAGLGLALSKELAEAMNAHFALASEEGRGTRAALSLLLP